MLTQLEVLIIVHHLSILLVRRMDHQARKTGGKEERTWKVLASRAMIQDP